MQTMRTLYPTTGLRLGQTLDLLQCDPATCSRTKVPFTIYVLGKQLSYAKLDDNRQLYFVALRLLFTACKHRKESWDEHKDA